VTDTGPAGKWIRRIDESGIYPLIDQARQLATDAQVDGDTEHADRERILAALTAVSTTLEGADPEVVREVALSEIVSSLNQINAHLPACAESPNAQYLAIALQQVEPMLAAASTIYQPHSVDDATKALTGFKQSVAASRSHVTRLVDDLETRLARLGEEHEAVIAQAAAESAAHAAAIATARQEIDRLQLLQQNAFDEAQTSRTTAHDAQLRSQRQEADQSMRAVEAELVTVRAAEAVKMQEAVAAANDSNTQIDEILGLVAEKGLVGQYAETADRERKLAKWWRIAAAAVAGGAIGVAIWSVAAHEEGGGWQTLVPKLTLTAVIGGVATYLGRVANDHRQAEKQARQVGLQLAAINPYLRSLEDPVLRDAVLSVVATQIFSGANARNDSDMKGPGATGQVGDVLLDEFLKAVVTRLKP